MRDPGINDIKRAMEAKTSVRSTTWVFLSFAVREDGVLKKAGTRFQNLPRLERNT